LENDHHQGEDFEELSEGLNNLIRTTGKFIRSGEDKIIEKNLSSSLLEPSSNDLLPRKISKALLKP
jgi:hypothetical protein